MKVYSIENGNQQNNEPMTNQLLITAIITTFAGGFHFGYLISAVNPLSDILQLFIFDNVERRYQLSLSPTELSLIWSTLAGCLFIGAMVGSYIFIGILPNIGPRKSLLAAAILLLFSSPIFGLAHVFDMVELLPISRCLSGVGFGIGISAQAVYLTEISPIKYRGFTNSLSGLVGNIAFLLASILGTPYVLGGKDNWMFIFFMEVVPCLIHILFNCTYFHESPKYLILQNKTVEAKSSLLAFHGKENERIIEDIQMELRMMKKENDTVRIFKDKGALRALSLSVAINFSVAFSGIVAMSFFGTFLLQTVGFSKEISTIANCFCSFASIISALLATFTMDRLGRRVLLITSLLVLALIDILMMILVYLFDSTKNETLAWPFLFLFVSFLFVFSVGIGPAAVFLGAELAPPGTISKVQSYSVSVQYIGSFICPILYMYLSSSIGAPSFLLFIVPLTVTAAYFYVYLPETKGKTATEINDLLRK